MDEQLAKARLGNVTASRIDSVLAQPKKGEPVSAMRMQYLWQLVLERYTGIPKENSFASKAMQSGIEREPAARVAYELQQGVEVTPAGYVAHPRIKRAGCSPDGLVGTKGLVEIKSPDPWRYGQACMGGEPDRKEILQVNWQLACTGREWCHLLTYSEGCPLAITLIEYNISLVPTLEVEVEKFLREVDVAYLAFVQLHGEPAR